MSLRRRIAEPETRAIVAADAVAEAEAAVRERPGLRGVGAQLGLETINRLRPGFLERHVSALLPDLAEALEPHWQQGVADGDATAHLENESRTVALALLQVTDVYVDQASDVKAIAVYRQLRSRAPARIAAEMPRIASFVAKHSL